jgi:hypothetical protein
MRTHIILVVIRELIESTPLLFLKKKFKKADNNIAGVMDGKFIIESNFQDFVSHIRCKR